MKANISKARPRLYSGNILFQVTVSRGANNLQLLTKSYKVLGRANGCNGCVHFGVSVSLRD